MHSLDFCSTGLKKDLAKAAKLDKSGKISKWSTRIINRLYWVAASMPPSIGENWADTVEAKWTSLANHVINKHKHSNQLHPRCAHPSRKRGEKKRKYFKRGINMTTILLLYQMESS